MTVQKPSMNHKTPPEDPAVTDETEARQDTTEDARHDTEVVLANHEDLCRNGCYREIEDVGPGSDKGDPCDWRTNRRVGTLMLVSVLSLYLCVFWLIYALSREGTDRPGLFISATCILFAVALFITLMSMKKLCNLLRPKHVFPVLV